MKFEEILPLLREGKIAFINNPKEGSLADARYGIRELPMKYRENSARAGETIVALMRFEEDDGICARGNLSSYEIMSDDWEIVE